MRPSNWFPRLAASAILVSLIASCLATDITVTSKKPPSPNPGVNVRYGLTYRDLERVVATIPGLQTVTPYRTMTAEARRGSSVQKLSLVGTIGQAVNAQQQVTKGRYLRASDVEQRNNVVVVSTQLADKLFGSDQAIGNEVRIADQYYTVCGTIRTPRRKPHNGYVAYVPITTMRARHGDTQVLRSQGQVSVEAFELSRIEIELEPNHDAERIAKLIKKVLAAHHPHKDYDVVVADESLEP